METTIKNFILIFTSVIYEAMPFIVLGAIISGILEEMLPQRVVVRILPRSRLLAIAIGGLLGLIFPMCECGIVPIMRRLLRKGLPLSCCTSYLLAGPIINVVVILSTLVAFSSADTGKLRLTDGALTSLRSKGVPETVLTKLNALKDKNLSTNQFQAELGAALNKDEMEQFGNIVVTQANTSGPQVRQLEGQFGSLLMTALRIGLGYVIAVTTSLIVDWQHRKYGNDLLTPLARPTGKADEEELEHQRQPAWKRLSNIAETALNDFVDIMAFLILGGLLAALVRVWLSHETIAVMSHQHIVLAILIMMAMAILLCLCSEADAFIAASFVTLPPAAKLAFLVLGPMVDLKLYMMYTRVFRSRLIFTIFGAVIIQVFVWSMLVHYIWLWHLNKISF